MHAIIKTNLSRMKMLCFSNYAVFRIIRAMFVVVIFLSCILSSSIHIEFIVPSVKLKGNSKSGLLEVEFIEKKPHLVLRHVFLVTLNLLTLIRPGGHYGPPPLHDFSDCSRTHMDGASPLADFFL